MNSMQKNDAAERFVGDEYGAPCAAERTAVGVGATLGHPRQRPLHAAARTHVSRPTPSTCRAVLPRSSSRC
jgi:hypothetical protein